jgi:hypothetical protein
MRMLASVSMMLAFGPWVCITDFSPGAYLIRMMRTLSFSNSTV